MSFEGPSIGHSRRRVLLIIGAGPTALGAVYRFCQLKRQGLIEEDVDVLVLEQEQEVGGLARSVSDEHGFTWDLGVHVMGISKYPDFVEALAECVPEWRVVPRCAMADMSHVMMAPEGEEAMPFPSLALPQDCYVPYPVQNSLPYFPERLKRQCLAELGENAEFGTCQQSKAVEIASGQDFDAFSSALFGPTLQRIFIRPYNEKVWTVPLAEMGTSWLQGRVPLVDFAQLTRRCGLPLGQLLAEDGQRQTAFRYPAGCRGVGQMWQRFADKLPAQIFRLGHRVVGIEPNGKLVRAKKQRGLRKEEEEEEETFHYDWLLSTLPLTELGQLSGLAPNLALKYSTVVLVGIGLCGGQSEFVRQLSWAYYPRPEIVFYRCTVLSNFSPELVPQQAQEEEAACAGPSTSSMAHSMPPSRSPFWSVLCEIGQASESPMPTGDGQRKALVEQVIADLIRVGIVRSRADVRSDWLQCLPFGYPIPTNGRDEVLASCQAKLETNQIYSRGRFGGWRYEVSNQDHSFQCGLELVDRLFMDIPECLYSSK